MLVETIKGANKELRETVTRLQAAGELTRDAADMFLRAQADTEA